MQIRRWVSPVLVAALLAMTAPVDLWAAGADPAKSTPHAADRLHAAITRAAAQATANPALQLRVMEPKSAARMQQSGGSHTGMIIGLVTTVVGVAATVYAVKAIQKNT